MTDSKLQRYIESSAQTISSLTQKVDALMAKVSNSENNYILLVRKNHELEGENKELRRLIIGANEKMSSLENQLSQTRKTNDENGQNFNRRLMNLEGESKEIERRLDRSNRADTETKISGNAEIQMMHSRVNSLAEEMRMSIENGKRWADQERERANKEMTETVREFRIHIEKELNELRHFVNAESERNKFSVSENESETRKIDDKIKQIIQRVKENEIHQREKHNKHKQNFESLNDKIEGNIDAIGTTVGDLYKTVDSKMALNERQIKGQIADLKKLFVLADPH